MEISEKNSRIYRYWMNCVKRARKARPLEKWKAAEERLKAAGDKYAFPDNRPYVNDYRKMHESLMAFLDQQEPTFKVIPTEPYMSDLTILKRAECEGAYLKCCWREQNCQKAQSRKLIDSVDINNGFTIIEFDKKKWMPSIRYLPARDVLIDRDCGGLIENANWLGYQEDISVEVFQSWHPELSDDALKQIIKKSGSVLSEEEREEVEDKDKTLYETLRVIHIFAKNSSAIKTFEKEKENEVGLANRRLADELEKKTPKRYLQFVEGFPSPVQDDAFWPFDLDHDEFPITHLQHNRVNNDTYGFTDYQQMERLDILSDNIIDNIGTACFWSSVQKLLGVEGVQIDPVAIDNFLNDLRETFLPNMADMEGRPKMVPVERKQINPAQLQAYDLLHNQAKEASALSELLENADAQAYKDVTALAARIVDANMHQRVNRRLSGPFGYEESIAEDAKKFLEVAHQKVPVLTTVAVIRQVPTGEYNEIGEPVVTEIETTEELAWSEVLTAVSQGGEIIQLGVEAVVGPELAKFWPYKEAPERWKLATKVTVEPGTTRSITRQQQAAIMKQLYVELYQPFYMLTGRLDLMRDYLEFIGQLAQVPNIDSKLPSIEDIKNFMIMQQQLAQQQAMAASGEQGEQGEQGGQPLNSPEANYPQGQQEEVMV